MPEDVQACSTEEAQAKLDKVRDELRSLRGREEERDLSWSSELQN